MVLPQLTIELEWGKVRLNRDEESIVERILRIEKYLDLRQLGDQIEQAIDEMQKCQTEMISRVVGAYEDFVKECKIMEK